MHKFKLAFLIFFPIWFQTLVALPAPEPIPQNCYAAEILEAQRLVKRAEIVFGYDGSTGPRFWSDLSPSNQLCSSGMLQSPINFPKNHFLVKGATPFELAWNANITDADFENEGTTVKALFTTDSKVIFNETEYTLKQFHFHTPSEHHFDGRALDAEVHFVHVSDNGKILVLGIPLEARDGEYLPVCENCGRLVEQLIPHLPYEAKTSNKIDSLNLEPVIRFISKTKWNSYKGSLTTPPCTEGVRFFISSKYLGITLSELRDLKKAIPFSARFTQPLNGRGKMLAN
ncbi:hypothetical protein HK096_009992 [Nowakowskiella sp. JEL0078]|nr:hypothetical protein HK096_009992 [Nowakowskiella sp. JEL0078]